MRDGRHLQIGTMPATLSIGLALVALVFAALPHELGR